MKTSTWCGCHLDVCDGREAASGEPVPRVSGTTSVSARCGLCFQKLDARSSAATSSSLKDEEAPLGVVPGNAAQPGCSTSSPSRWQGQRRITQLVPPGVKMNTNEWLNMMTSLCRRLMPRRRWLAWQEATLHEPGREASSQDTQATHTTNTAFFTTQEASAVRSSNLTSSDT